jgi:hypothetical protein
MHRLCRRLVEGDLVGEQHRVFRTGAEINNPGIGIVAAAATRVRAFCGEAPVPEAWRRIEDDAVAKNGQICADRASVFISHYDQRGSLPRMRALLCENADRLFRPPDFGAGRLLWVRSLGARSKRPRNRLVRSRLMSGALNRSRSGALARVKTQARKEAERAARKAERIAREEEAKRRNARLCSLKSPTCRS